MTSINDVLKASKGLPVDDIFAELWGRKLSGGYTIATYTGTLPAVLSGTKAGYLHRYKIYGNTEQTGTPTPENPIVPSECGELETTGVHAGQYRLPLTSAGQSVDIYIGESQTTRRIKKLVLTGNEDCYPYDFQGQKGALIFGLLDANHTREKGFCSHYRVYPNGASTSLWIGVNNKNLYFVGIFDVLGISTIDEFKSFLAAQYAAGTPVTVWYILAEPETGTLNEPLRKIGDYADTIDSTQTTAQIPTTAGSTTISWAGSGLAPSEVELTYEKE